MSSIPYSHPSQHVAHCVFCGQMYTPKSYVAGFCSKKCKYKYQYRGYKACRQQIDNLTKFLLNFYNNEIGFNTITGQSFPEEAGAVGVAIRLLSCHKKEHRLYRVLNIPHKCPCFKGRNTGNP